MEFSIYNSRYELFSTGLTKFMVLYLFIDKKIGKNDKPIIRDYEGLDMNFNEFLEIYCPEWV